MVKRESNSMHCAFQGRCFLDKSLFKLAQTYLKLKWNMWLYFVDNLNDTNVWDVIHMLHTVINFNLVWLFFSDHIKITHFLLQSFILCGIKLDTCISFIEFEQFSYFELWTLNIDYQTSSFVNKKRIACYWVFGWVTF